MLFRSSFLFPSHDICELNEYGWLVIGAKKGRDSVNFGIGVLQAEEFFVTTESTNIIKELRAYMWLTDKTGKKLNEPIDMYNHSIDGMRYFAIMKMSKHIDSDVDVDID